MIKIEAFRFFSQKSTNCPIGRSSLFEPCHISIVQVLKIGSNNNNLRMGQLVLFCEKTERFNIYKIQTYHISFSHKLNVLSEYRPIGATFFEEKYKEVTIKPFFTKDKCAPLKLPEEITTFLRIGYFYEPPIFLDQFPTSHCCNGFTSIHVIHHYKVSVKVIREKEEFWRQVEKLERRCEIIVIIGHLDSC